MYVLLVDLCYMTEILSNRLKTMKLYPINQSIILLVDVYYNVCVLYHEIYKVLRYPAHIAPCICFCKQNATKLTYIKRHFTV